MWDTRFHELRTLGRKPERFVEPQSVQLGVECDEMQALVAGEPDETAHDSNADPMAPPFGNDGYPANMPVRKQAPRPDCRTVG